MVVQKGYKLTDIGVIPDNWDTMTLGNVAEIKTGPFGSALHAEDYVVVGTPIITVEHLGDYSITRQNLPLVCSEDKNRLKAYLLQEGDIVFSRVGSVDRNAYVTRLEDGWLFSGRLLRIRSKEHNINTKFLSYYFKRETIRKKIRGIAVGQTMASLNTKLLSTFPILLPPLPEQQAIVTALYDIDELILSLEKLIAKKKDIQLGAMQELLTGKKRLLGFKGKWVEKSLGELFVFTGGLSASRKQLSTIGCCYLHYGDIHSSMKTYIDVEDDYYSIPKLDIQLSKVSLSTLLSDGDVVFVDASEDDDGASKHVVVKNKANKPFISGLHTIVAKSKGNEIVHSYRAYCFQTEGIKFQFKYYAAGTKVTGISKGNITKIKLLYPVDTAEQTAIATVLSDMDSEIIALEHKLTKYRNTKLGVMQELLTGRIRLVETIVNKQTHSREFDEAIIISALVATFGNAEHPMTSFRRQKYSYFLHRHWSSQAEGYGKFAAGPYNPKTKYGGPESIALRKKYVKEHFSRYKGFIAGEHSQEAVDYFKEWYGKEPLEWLEQFRYQKKDELELLATVDMAIIDLQKAQKPITVAAVKAIINSNDAWKDKLTKPGFSDGNIAQAIERSNELFGNS